jgi:TatD DNase family protein
MIFDTHIHLDRFSPGLPIVEEVAAARAIGVSHFLVPGVDRDGWSKIRQIVSRTEGGLAAYGLHPLAAADWSHSCREELMTLLGETQTVAVGEIGLDRYVDVPVDQQEFVFREQIRIAIQASLPVLIHCRKMPGRLLEILAEERCARVGGIMHAFSGSLQTAKKAIDLGFALSFGGALTYPEARRVLDVLTKVPDEMIVIETDAPDLAPHPHRGELNRPVWISLILDRLAEVKGWSRQQAAEITSENARRILKQN